MAMIVLKEENRIWISYLGISTYLLTGRKKSKLIFSFMPFCLTSIVQVMLCICIRQILIIANSRLKLLI